MEAWCGTLPSTWLLRGRMLEGDRSPTVVQSLSSGSSSCGYCGNGKAGRGSSTRSTSRTIGGGADQLTVDEYQGLLDRGWRRSGCYLYHPLNKETCCPQYAIRLNTASFQPSKEQRRTKRKFENFLARGGPAVSLPRTSHASSQAGSQELTQQREEEKAMSASATAVQIDLASTPHIPDQDQRTSGQHQISSRQVSKPDRAVTPQTVEVLARLLTQVIEAAVTAGRLRDVQYPSARLIAPSPKQQKQLTEDIVLTSPTALAMSAASSLAAVDSVQLAEEFAHTLQQRLQESNVQRELGAIWVVHAAGGHLNFSCTTSADQQQSKACTDTLPSACQSQGPRLPPNKTAKLAASQLPGKSASAASCAVYNRHASTSAASAGSSQPAERAQSSSGSPSLQQEQPFNGAAHRLELKLVKMPCSAAVCELELPLFQKYQMRQHKEKLPSMASFNSFLVQTPLLQPHSERSGGRGPEGQGYGSYHQQWWLDGVLIAVGVLDVLPSCISSVYFFWDPDLASLSLGKVSALQEIELARSLLSGPDPACPQLRYYCMGFYIHSCPKMRYKAAFQPSELLCPETFCWVPFERLRAALDAHRYVAFSQVPHALDGLAEEHGVIEAAPQDPTALEVSSTELASSMLLLEGVDPPRLLSFGQLLSCCLPRQSNSSRRTGAPEMPQVNARDGDDLLV